MPGDQTHQLGGLQITGQAQRVQNVLLIHPLASPGALVQKGEGVPQAAVGQAGQQGGALTGQVDPLLLGHIAQALGDLSREDPLEGKLLAPGFDGGRDLVQLGGGQNEHQVGGGLLQDLQQGVEGRGGQHMDLVHDVHPLPHGGGGVHRLVPQGADLVHAVVGGGVQFQYIQNGAVFNAQAGGALVAGVAVHRSLTVHRPGQDLGAGGLAGAPGAGEEIGVGEAVSRHLLLEGVGNMALPHHIVKGAGPPLAV